MAARLLAFLAAFAALGAAGYAVWRYLPPLLAPGVPATTAVESPPAATAEADVLRPVDVSVSTPGPLAGPREGRATRLTQAGVLRWTNAKRRQAGVSELRGNSALDAAADRKLADMFARQYFAHDNPDGEGIDVSVQQSGYRFLRVGENLALGNFGSDEALVAAWMGSSGHRANILNRGFSEIGIAVGEGTFRSHRTWLAVQVFALPASTCPAPDALLRSAIDREQETLAGRVREVTEAQEELATQRARLAALAAEIRQLIAEGNAKIEEGNREIEEGNRIARETGDREAAQAHWDRGEQLQEEGRALHAQARERQAAYVEAEEAFKARAASVNREVEDYARRRAALRERVARYNARVEAFNACVGST